MAAAAATAQFCADSCGPSLREHSLKLPTELLWFISARMDASQSLSQNDFAHIVRFSPLVAIDLIIRDPEGNVLLGLRANEPAKGTYFVPGGVIRKNERIRDAFTRILHVETGLAVSFDEATLLGVFEHFYETNRFGHPDYGTHYVVLAYQVPLKAKQAVAIDSQHIDVQWMPEDEINSAADIHPHTKAYF
jgi:colanic acid biosynthesis protein WcaH